MNNILIAEDHRLTAELLKRYLNNNFEQKKVSIASNGKILLSMLKQNIPDLLLLDLNMPEINGLKALRKIREQNKKIKIVVISAFNEQWIIKEAKQYGADLYFCKSIDFRKLLQIISKLEQNATDLPFAFT